MHSIMDDNNMKLLKMRYDLFNKSDLSVYYKIVEIVKDKIKIRESGLINSNGVIEKLKSDINIQSFNSVRHFTDPDGNENTIYFKTKFVLNDDDDYKIVSSANIEIDYDRSENSYINEQRIISVSNKDKIIPKSNKIYMVVIYPNNHIPALIRVYDNDAFDIFDIEDTSAIYNSYIEPIDVDITERFIQENRNTYHGIPISKYNDQPYVNYFQDLLSMESIENGTYSNTYNNIVINEDISINGINFDKALENLNDNACMITLNINTSDSNDKLVALCNMLSELDYPVNSRILVRQLDNTYYIDEARWSAIICDTTALVYKHSGARPISRFGEVEIIDLKNFTIITSCKVELLPPNDNAKSDISISIWGRVRGTNDNQDIISSYNITNVEYGSVKMYYRNPLEFIRFIQKIIINEKIKTYILNSGIIILNEKFIDDYASRMYKITENNKEFILVRGPIGELLKREL